MTVLFSALWQSLLLVFFSVTVVTYELSLMKLCVNIYSAMARSLLKFKVRGQTWIIFLDALSLRDRTILLISPAAGVQGLA